MVSVDHVRMAYSDSTMQAAAERYHAGMPTQQICDQLKINSRQVIYRWRDKYGWDDDLRPENVRLTASRRLNWLIDQETKTDADLQEIVILSDSLVKLAKAAAYDRGQPVGTGRPPGVKNGEGKKKKPRKKNDVSHITQEACDQVREKLLYPHQKIWYNAGQNEQTNLIRFILKGRQEGATFTFAYEAFENAVLKQRNQIFISATRAQAEVFKSYIYTIARDHFEVEVSGNPIKLSNGAELYFLSPNSYAQSRSGDVYFDEVFWTRKFTAMEELAAPMATLDDCKLTYFSTPSAYSHDAYEIWSGKRYTQHNKQVVVDVSDHKSMREGKLFDDGIWRCVTTIHDAIDMGYDKVTVKKLRIKTPDKKHFANIYECKFIDDSESEFNLQEILNCAIDLKTWKDFDADAVHPIGSIPCAGGYDPGGKSDNGSFVVTTFPQNVHEKFRLLRKHVWRNIRAPEQCQIIRSEIDAFNFEFMSVDNTGPGVTVGDFIEDIFPTVQRSKYSPEYKTRMVQKAKTVFAAKRFEYDENDTTLPLAFLTIHYTTTQHGAMTYVSSRNEEVGHGDEAWATMEAMMCERLNPHDRTVSITSVN